MANFPSFLPSLARTPSLATEQRSEHYKSKSQLVISALKNTFKFVKQLRIDGADVDFIIVPFDNFSNIYSTYPLPTIAPQDGLLKTINLIQYDDMEHVIKSRLHPSGGTDFVAIENADQYINKYLNEEITPNIKIIKYIMSDGQSNNKEILMSSKEHRYDYCLGIGNETQYDKQLLGHLGKNMIGGDDETAVNDSLIGDPFGAISKLDINVKTTVYTTAKPSDFKTNLKVIGSKSNVVINPEQFLDDQLFIPILSNNNTVKLIGRCPPIRIPEQKIVFIFYVDISGSMGDIIGRELSFPSASFASVPPPGFGFPPSDDKHSLNEVIPLDDVHILSDINTIMVDSVVSASAPAPAPASAPAPALVLESPYYSYELESIEEFHTYNEVYFDIKTPLDAPIYVKIESNTGTYYCKTLNMSQSFENNDDLLISKFCDLMEQFKSIRLLEGDEQVQAIKDLGEFIRCPENNRLFKTIKQDPTPSRIRLYYIALITQIKKQVQNVLESKRSDRLLNQMMDRTPMDLARAVSCGVSTQYSSPYPPPDMPNLNISDEYDVSINCCTICNDNVRDIVYDCGHVVCKDCTIQIFFKIDPNVEINTHPRAVPDSDSASANPIVDDIPNLYPMYRQQTNYMSYDSRTCPVCRKNVNTVQKLLVVDSNKDTQFKCLEQDCLNLSQRMSEDCGHLTYCNKCWKIRKTANNLICHCNVPITKYRKVFH